VKQVLLDHKSRTLLLHNSAKWDVPEEVGCARRLGVWLSNFLSVRIGKDVFCTDSWSVICSTSVTMHSVHISCLELLHFNQKTELSGLDNSSSIPNRDRELSFCHFIQNSPDH